MAVADRLRVEALCDLFFDAVESAAANEEYIGRVDLDEFLVGVLASPLGRYVDDRSFEDFEQRLLYALARHVARDRRVVAFAGDLVDLVDEDDAPFRQRYVVVGYLEQPRKDAFDVFADITGLGEHSCIDDRKRYVQQLRDRAGQQRFTRTGLSDHHDVRLVDVDITVRTLCVHQPFVMVVDRHRHIAFRGVLPDHVLVEECLDFGRFEQFVHLDLRCALFLYPFALGEHVVPAFDALVADLRPVAAGKQYPHLAARLSAERAVVFVGAVMIFVVCHGVCLGLLSGASRRITPEKQGNVFARCYLPRLTSTSSIRPYSFASGAVIQ